MHSQVAKVQSCANILGSYHLPHRQNLNCIYFSFILLAGLLTDEGGEETRAPDETPDGELQKLENATH